MKNAEELRKWLSDRAVEVKKGKLNRLDAIAINKMTQSMIRSAELELRYAILNRESGSKMRKIPFLEGGK
jgi:hypothetical protein